MFPFQIPVRINHPRVLFQEHLVCPPPHAAPLLPASIPGFSGLPACVPIDLRKLPARKTGV